MRWPSIWPPGRLRADARQHRRHQYVLRPRHHPALLQAPRDHAQRMTAHAAEQAHPERERRALFRGQLDLDPARLVFIDETWAKTNMTRTHGRCRRGTRHGCAPWPLDDDDFRRRAHAVGPRGVWSRSVMESAKLASPHKMASTRWQKHLTEERISSADLVHR